MDSGVLITGGAVRLGRAIALKCAQMGWPVVIHYRASTAEAEALVAEIQAAGGIAVAVQADLEDIEQTRDLLARARETIGRPITRLVNSASIFEWDNITTVNQDSFTRHLTINTLSPLILIQKFIEFLPVGEFGSVVNILDQKLAAANGDHLSYTLSKFALGGATDVLARANAKHLRINAVAPGYTLPAPGQGMEDFERLHGQTPMGIGPTPENVADAVAFLLNAPTITGQTIFVDAGARFVPAERDYSFR